MVMWADLPPEAYEDPFAPPDEPCVVECIHCGREYTSDLIVWREEDDGGFWCCPTPGCDGVGFRFDIWPLGSWCDDGCEDDEDAEEAEEQLGPLDETDAGQNSPDRPSGADDVDIPW